MEMGKVARKREFSILQTPPTEKLAKLGEVNVEEEERAVRHVFYGLSGAVVLYHCFCLIDGITCGSKIMRTY